MAPQIKSGCHRWSCFEPVALHGELPVNFDCCSVIHRGIILSDKCVLKVHDSCRLKQRCLLILNTEEKLMAFNLFFWWQIGGMRMVNVYLYGPPLTYKILDTIIKMDLRSLIWKRNSCCTQWMSCRVKLCHCIKAKEMKWGFRSSLIEFVRNWLYFVLIFLGKFWYAVTHRLCFRCFTNTSMRGFKWDI